MKTEDKTAGQGTPEKQPGKSCEGNAAGKSMGRESMDRENSVLKNARLGNATLENAAPEMQAPERTEEPSGNPVTLGATGSMPETPDDGPGVLRAPGKGVRWATVFPAAANVHLLKDVGMLPFIMHRDYGYDATLVCFRNDATYPALENEVKGLRLHFLDPEPGYIFGKVSRRVLAYLRKHAREIDVLNLYHTNREMMAYAAAYKWFHPKGRVYVKLDLDIRAFDAQKTQRFHRWRLAGYRLFFRYFADVVSCELPSAREYLVQAIPSLENKLVVVPNGIDDRTIRAQDIAVFPFEKKENLLITVGRLGSYPKNTEFLLRALEQVDLKGWKVALIGPEEPGFRERIASFFNRNPHWKEQVVLTGNIADRAELYRWYNRAKVFCLTSRFESFGIVYAEALYFGDYIVSTDVAPAIYMTDAGRAGRIVENEAALARTIQEMVDGRFDLAARYEAVRKHSEKFRWSPNLAGLARRLRS